MMQVPGQRGIGNRGAGVHDGITGLGEEERRLAVGILAHLAGVGRVVAPDAEDAAHGETSGSAGDGDRRLRWRLNHVVGHGYLD
jgi:hypothetical protein